MLTLHIRQIGAGVTCIPRTLYRFGLNLEARRTTDPKLDPVESMTSGS